MRHLIASLGLLLGARAPTPSRRDAPFRRPRPLPLPLPRPFPDEPVPQRPPPPRALETPLPELLLPPAVELPPSLVGRLRFFTGGGKSSSAPAPPPPPLPWIFAEIAAAPEAVAGASLPFINADASGVADDTSLLLPLSVRRRDRRPPPGSLDKATSCSRSVPAIPSAAAADPAGCHLRGGVGARMVRRRRLALPVPLPAELLESADIEDPVPSVILLLLLLVVMVVSGVLSSVELEFEEEDEPDERR